MPELPEVETIRRDLERELVGRRVVAVSATHPRSTRRHASASDFAARLVGRTVEGVGRRGKYLVVRLDDGALVAHLRMSGQLLLAPGDTAHPNDTAHPGGTMHPDRTARPAHTHVVLALDDGRELRFVDPRTFGEMFVTTADAPELAHLGFEPLDDPASPERLGALLAGRRSHLKALLVDQGFVAGIGNLYADEILFAAGLRHDRLAHTLSPDEVGRLQRAVVDVLTEAVEHRGSSLADEQYRDLYGLVGAYQSRHRVYGREGEACARCAGPIARAKWAGRSTFYCGRCQA